MKTRIIEIHFVWYTSHFIILLFNATGICFERYCIIIKCARHGMYIAMENVADLQGIECLYGIMYIQFLCY